VTVRVAVVGSGSMGANHARVIDRIAGADLTLVVDTDAGRAKVLGDRFGVPFATSIEKVAGSAEAAIVAVPTDAHPQVATRLLDAGIDVLVEKPLASNTAEAAAIVEAAARTNRLLAVGHIERFNPVSLELLEISRDPLFVSTLRTSPFDGRIKEGVIGDLMVHDIDLVLALAGAASIVRVSAASTRVRSESDDLATATIAFSSGMIAQLTASRISQQKVRRIDIVERDSTIQADLLHQGIEVRRETTVAFVDEGGTRLRETTTVEIPYLDRRGEPLVAELEDFVQAVTLRRRPLVDGVAGLRSLEVCEQLVHASRSRRTSDV
jgi:predicted dehydrogenase